MKPTCFSLLHVESDFGATDTTDKSFTVLSSPVEALNLIIRLKISARWVFNSTIELHVPSRRKESLQLYCSVDFDFLALMRFDMTFHVTLRDSVIKNVSFSLLLVTFSIKANFQREYLWKSIYLRFPGSLKPSSSICYILFSSEEKYCGALLLFRKIPLKLN